MEYWGLVDRMDGMCVALGCVYQMNGFIVNIVLRSIARDRLVLALAQEKHIGGSRRIPRLARVDATHTRPVPAAHPPIAELYRV